MKRSFLILLHMAFWAILAFLVLIFLGILTHSDIISGDEIDYFSKVMLSVLIIPAVFSFYIFYTFLFNRYLRDPKIYKAVVYGLGLAFIASIIGSLALYFTIDFTISCQRESNFMAFPVITFIGIIFGSIALVFKGFLTWFKEIKLKKDLLEKNHKMELALVKSQLDPHFLFNTINNIGVLMLEDSEEASNYLNKLSDIMRFMLFETKDNEILLEDELLYIEKYIALQKIRTANSKYVTYEVIGDPKGKYIAPMAFIPFIENAFKHTNNKKVEDAICIKIIIEEDNITLKCINKFNPDQNNGVVKNGLGNELITKRLNLIYPKNHTLKINQERNEYSVNLTISK